MERLHKVWIVHCWSSSNPNRRNDTASSKPIATCCPEHPLVHTPHLKPKVRCSCYHLRTFTTMEMAACHCPAIYRGAGKPRTYFYQALFQELHLLGQPLTASVSLCRDTRRYSRLLCHAVCALSQRQDKSKGGGGILQPVLCLEVGHGEERREWRNTCTTRA